MESENQRIKEEVEKDQNEAEKIRNQAREQ